MVISSGLLQPRQQQKYRMMKQISLVPTTRQWYDPQKSPCYAPVLIM